MGLSIIPFLFGPERFRPKYGKKQTDNVSTDKPSKSLLHHFIISHKLEINGDSKIYPFDIKNDGSPTRSAKWIQSKPSSKWKFKEINLVL